MEKVFRALNADADMQDLSLDSTRIKVHESANGGEKTENKKVGRSRGGLNTKLYVIVDGPGNPVELMLSPGNDHDSIHDPTAGRGQHQTNPCTGRPGLRGCGHSELYFGACGQLCDPPKKATRLTHGQWTGTYTRNVIWWNVFSRKSNGSGGLPLVMINWISNSLLSFTSPLLLFWSFSIDLLNFQTRPRYG